MERIIAEMAAKMESLSDPEGPDQQADHPDENPMPWLTASEAPVGAKGHLADPSADSTSGHAFPADPSATGQTAAETSSNGQAGLEELRAPSHADAVHRPAARDSPSAFPESKCADQVTQPNVRPVGRNQQCPCGSHRKFKACCGRHKNGQLRENVDAGQTPISTIFI